MKKKSIYKLIPSTIVPLILLIGSTCVNSFALENVKAIENISSISHTYGNYKKVFVTSNVDVETFNRMFTLYKLSLKSVSSKASAEQIVKGFSNYLIDKGYVYTNVSYTFENDILGIFVNSLTLGNLTINSDGIYSGINKKLLIRNYKINHAFNSYDLRNSLASLVNIYSYSDSSIKLKRNGNSVDVNIDVDVKSSNVVANRPFSIFVSPFNSLNPSIYSKSSFAIRGDIYNLTQYADSLSVNFIKSYSENLYFKDYYSAGISYVITPYVTDKYINKVTFKYSKNNVFSKSVLQYDNQGKIIPSLYMNLDSGIFLIDVNNTYSLDDYNTFGLSVDYIYRGREIKDANDEEYKQNLKNSIFVLEGNYKYSFVNKDELNVYARLNQGLAIHGDTYDKTVFSNGGLDQSSPLATTLQFGASYQSSLLIGKQDFSNNTILDVTLSNESPAYSALKMRVDAKYTRTIYFPLVETGSGTRFFLLSSRNGFALHNISNWYINGSLNTSVSWTNSYYQFYDADFANLLHSNNASLLWSELSLSYSYRNLKLNILFGSPLYFSGSDYIRFSDFNTGLSINYNF